MNKRINYIDIAKAFAIMFIVLGHTLVYSEHCSLIFKFLYSFHVVLFFVLSGYTFKIKDEKFSKFFKNKFLRIMIPYFIWSTLFLIPYMLFGNDVGNNLGTNSSFDIKLQFLNIFYGNGNNAALKQNSSLWFLPALFSMEVIYYFIIRYLKKAKDILILLFLIVISYITNYFSIIILPWGLNTVLNVGIFFYIGYLFRDYNLFTKEKLFKVVYILPIFIIGLLAFYYNKTVSCIEYEYGSLTLAIVSGICLSIFVIYISYLVKENKIIEYIGKNTMGILIFHKLIILIFQTKLGAISNLLRNSNFFTELGLSIIISVLAIIFSLIANEVIKKFCPILIGHKK